jgi:hypothetical protein
MGYGCFTNATTEFASTQIICFLATEQTICVTALKKAVFVQRGNQTKRIASMGMNLQTQTPAWTSTVTGAVKPAQPPSEQGDKHDTR